MNSLHPIPGRLWIIQLAEELSRRVERRVSRWPASQRKDLGDQWTRSTDSIGENISEGYARMHIKERLHFLSIAQGSLEEALFQLRRARDRHLLSEFEAKSCPDCLSGFRMESMRWPRSKRVQRQENRNGGTADTAG